MLPLIIGLLLFFLPHLLREVGMRDVLLNKLGSETAYKGTYSLVALLGLALIIYGKSVAPFQMIYAPPFELRWVSHLIMLPATILSTLGNLPTSYLAKALRHPMLLGVIMWGGAHLWANGDLASLLLFASFELWAVIKFAHLSISQPPRRSASILWDIVGIVLGLIVYALVFTYHGQLFGVGLSIV